MNDLRYRRQGTDAEELNEIRRIVRGYEERVRYYFGAIVESDAAHVACLLGRYEEIAVSRIAVCEQFRTDIVNHLRALSLVVDMTGNASTHAEKNARLRGLSELLESAIATLRVAEFDMDSTYWRFPDAFRSNYPIRSYLEQIREKNVEIAELRRQVEASRPLTDTPGDGEKDLFAE